VQAIQPTQIDSQASQLASQRWEIFFLSAWSIASHVHMHSAAAAQHKGVLFNILPTKRFSMILSSPGIAATPETDTVAPFVQRIEHESYMSAVVSVPLPAAEPAPGKRRSVSGAPQV